MSAVPPARLFLEEALARPMFFLAVGFLIVLGGLLHRHKLPDPDALVQPGGDAVVAPADGPLFDPVNIELQIQVGLLLAMWPFFVAEGLFRLWQTPPGRGWWRPLRDFVAVSLIPPWRMAQRSQGPGHQLWLPGFGWRTVDRFLRRDLERAFGWPMIGIALLILPLLIAEFFFKDAIKANFWLLFAFEFGNALVWFAFALEFILMLAVAQHRFRYAITHWIDLAIILLPFVHFLPLFRVLRLGQLLRLDQIARLGRLYRMQGVALRAWRAFLLLQLIQRVLGTSIEKQLAQLRELEAAKQEEMDDLRQEIRLLEEELARQQAANPTAAPADDEDY